MCDLLRPVRLAREFIGHVRFLTGVAPIIIIVGTAASALPSLAGNYREPYEPRPPLLAPFESGGFGRLFPLRDPDDLKSLGFPEHRSRFNALDALGRSMVENCEPDDPAGDSELPAGYTYFGQFLDHDITFDATTELGRKIRSDSEHENASTPDLDLDNVYGGGPVRSPHLYRLPYLKVGNRINGYEIPRYDLARTTAVRRYGPGGGRQAALLGDPRDDQNLIISQLHAAFVALHNRTVDILISRHFGDDREQFCRDDRCDPRQVAQHLPEEIRFRIFSTAHDHVIHYYHRVILEDYLPRIIGTKRVADILKRGRDFYYPHGFRDETGRLREPTIPVEFAVAAFRFGHSQVRSNYQLREGMRANIFGSRREGTGIRAFEPVTPRYVIDWRYFFDIDPVAPQNFNYARRIDPFIVGALNRLDMARVVGEDDVESLAARDLVRGRTWRLPVGQDVAEHILPVLLERGVIKGRNGPRLERSTRNSPAWQAYVLRPDGRTEHFLGREGTPLWYYVLQEAAVFGTRTGLQSLPPYAVNGNGDDDGNGFDHNGDGNVFGHRLRSYRPNGPLPWRPVAYDGREWLNGNGNGNGDELRWRDGGHRLGPVGGTIVGEVLIGLLEHYREKTGKGLAYRPEVRGGTSLFGAPDGSREPRERYMMRNLLLDAGVARLN